MHFKSFHNLYVRTWRGGICRTKGKTLQLVRAAPCVILVAHELSLRLGLEVLHLALCPLTVFCVTVGPRNYLSPSVDWRGSLLALRGRYGQEFRQLLARDPNDKNKYKDHDTLLSFYTEDVMRAAEREVRALIRVRQTFGICETCETLETPHTKEAWGLGALFI